MSDELSEIEEILEGAENEWNSAQEEKNIQKYQSAEKLFLLAIKKAGSPLPHAHASLAWLYYEMHFLYYTISPDKSMRIKLAKSALEQSDIALKHDSENLTAQFIKVWINLYYIDGPDNNLLRGWGYKKEMEKLATLFKKILGENILGALNTLIWVEKMMNLAEFCEKKSYFGAKEIYPIISSISVNDLDFEKIDPDKVEDLKREIRQFKIKAESRLI